MDSYVTFVALEQPIVLMYSHWISYTYSRIETELGALLLSMNKTIHTHTHAVAPPPRLLRKKYLYPVINWFYYKYKSKNWCYTHENIHTKKIEENRREYKGHFFFQIIETNKNITSVRIIAAVKSYIFLFSPNYTKCNHSNICFKCINANAELSMV